MRLLPRADTIKLLRIPFSLFLMPVYLLCLSQAPVQPLSALFTFLIIHFLVYPASNGYNSYIDKDTQSIGGIEKPPLPTRELFRVTLFMDLLAVIASGLLVNLFFAFCVVCYILASRAYSAPQTRLKKYSVAGFLIVVIFQGAFTYYMCYAGIAGIPPPLNSATLFILLACSFQIAGAYPLTQIYQHQQDYSDGVVTLSYRLGYRGTFLFAGTMFALCGLFYYLYFSTIHQLQQFIYIQVFFIPLIAYFTWWSFRTWNDSSSASYSNTMRMNLVASVSMGACFILLTILKYTP
jgi:4-hydroxybenzoate polyprenyltransferase